MDKYKVKVNPQAIRELDLIYDYIAKEKMSPENARRQADRIKNAILGLDIFPQSHQKRNVGRYAGKGYRQLLVDNYIAVFQNSNSAFFCFDYAERIKARYMLYRTL